MKSNPHPILLKELASLGSSFDCASGSELEEVGKLGYVASQYRTSVVYANPCKPHRDLETAFRLGCPVTVVDSFGEVEKLKEASYSGGTLIRIRVKDRNSLMPFSSKFGIDPTQVKDLALFAKGNGIQIKGVSFHVGSGCNDKTQYKLAIETAHKCMKDIETAGFQPNLIDIGGGFLPKVSLFPSFASTIRDTMCLQPNYIYIAEPGRFFSTSAFDLFVPVIGKKPAHNTSGWQYTLDESLYGQFSCVAFDQKTPIWLRIPKEENEKPRKLSPGTLYGRTCDAVDMIAKTPYMEELEVGDWLWFPNMGAYSSVTASEFNGFPKPDVFDSRGVELPSLQDIKDVKDRLPYNVTTVNGVCLGNSLVPAVA